MKHIIAKLEPVLLALGHSPELVALAVQEQMAQTPKLKECSPDSIAAAALKAIFLGLNLFPAADEAYIRPRKDRAILVPGYRGLITLAYADPRVAYIEAHCVFPGDKFSLDLSSDRPITHVISPIRKGDEKPIGAYAILWWKNHPRPLIEYMTAAEIDANARRGGGFGNENSPWVTDWPQMARKTVIKRLLNYVGQTAKIGGTLSPAQTAALCPEETTLAPASGGDMYQSIRQQIEKAGADELSTIIRQLRNYQELDSHEKEELFNLARTRKHELARN